MSETQELLTKIAALRQRLEQAQSIVQDAGSAVAALSNHVDPIHTLLQKTARGGQQQKLLDATLRPLSDATAVGGDGAALPASLTSRAARLLRRTHELLGQLRGVADDALTPAVENNPLAPL